MQMVMGAWVSKVIADLTRLHIPDTLKCHGALTADEIVAHGVRVNAEFLQRTMRAAASFGLVTEDASGKFGPTTLSDVLAADTPGSVKKLVECFGTSWWKVWTGLYDAIRNGDPQSRNQLGMEFWDYLQANPKEMEDFGEAMKANSTASMQGVLAHCDFSQARKVADVAGGFGHLLIALLERYPGLQGVLMDLPELIPVAKIKLPVTDPQVAARMEYVGGDMFEAVPPADVYIMKHIIHDWPDDRCVQLLSNCVRSMEGNGRVLCVDAVVPPMGDVRGTPSKLLDLHMMVFVPGKERTLQQWQSLYHAAGLEIKSVTPLNDNFGTSVVEGVKR
jgi:ubiquinone/menaquinone biosynthesis C-methylase UbiE